MDNGWILPKTDIIPVGKETFVGIKAVAKAIVNTKCIENVCRKTEVTMIKPKIAEVIKIKGRTPEAKKENSFFNQFRRYNEMLSFLEGKKKKYSSMINVTSIGKTVEGRDIKLIKIGQNIQKESKTIIYIDGGTHAREWVAISTAFYLIEHLLKDYAENDTDATLLLKQYDFYIIPLINVDGYEYTHTKVGSSMKVQ